MGQFGSPMSVRYLVNGIKDGEYYLPSIQREFVWEIDRITRLFDSLMKGYPIGSFLFWKVPKEKIADFQFYEFIRNYHPLTKTNNGIQLTKSDRPFIAILDGQQRMTSLFIGLRGTYAEKIKNKPVNNKNSYIVKQLYVNLLKLLDPASDDNEKGLTYDFKFLSESQVSKLNESGKDHWFKVGDILNFSEPASVNKYLKNQNLYDNDNALDILTTLRDRILTATPINYYIEDNADLSEVVNVFIRINSGGKVLNPSDLLLSFATAQLQGIRDVRSSIRNFLDMINNIGESDNFAFDKDFVLKAFLVLCDAISNIKFKVTNFDKTNMKEIHSHWDEMTDAIELAVKLIASYGFKQKNIVSTNAIIPIAHYILKKGNNPALYKEDKNIIRWFILASLGGTFRASTDTVLGNLRNIINKGNPSFPAQEMLELDKKDISVDTIINEILNTTYKDKSRDMAIFILYPHINLANNHIDHIFPQSKFKKKTLSDNNITDTDFYMNNFNSFANLQLLTAHQNQSKKDKDFDEWLKKMNPADREAYNTDDHCIPMDINLSFGNFKEFIQKREELIRQRLKENLKSWNIFI